MTPQVRREPKYHAIAADLTAKIRSGDYPPGGVLPAQRELSATYGVTLATLRQALRRLEDEGLLSQQPGRGTFVAEPTAAYQLGSLRSLADDLREQGQTVSTEIVAQALRKVPGSLAPHLGLPPGARALRLERVRLLAGRPAVHQVSWVRDPYASELTRVDFSDVSLYHALADLGVVVHRAGERLRPALLAEPVAGRLRAPAGIAVFVSERITYGLDDAPVVFDRATILGDAMEIRTERAATKLSVQWRRHGS